MSNELRNLLADPGPHTIASLAARLSHFPRAAIEQALEALTAQGVLECGVGEGGTPEYRYVAPERYAQANLDVVRDPAAPHRRRTGRA